ncbi:MAG: prolyl oligopeptidase family serine peptidase [Bacteroidetes bacterium]|nr:prolyl oligopeptidase family serine peptidase [Bacteroidota bacterium]
MLNQNLTLKTVVSIFVLLFSFIITQAQHAEFDVPKAQKKPYSYTIHGYEISDPYHWLKEKQNPEVINYLYAENAYADNIMKPTMILQKRLYEEFKGNFNENYSSLPTKRDSFYYYTRLEKSKDYPIFCRKKDSLQAAEEIYFDANEIAKEFRFFQIGIFSISPGHNWLAYGIDDNGGRLSNLYFKNLITGETTEDTLPKMLSMIWANDNKTIYYITPEEKTIRGNRVFKHILGTPASMDELVFEEPDKTFEINLRQSTSKKFIFLDCSKTKSNETWYFDADGPDSKLKLIQQRHKNLLYSANHFENNEFYIRTNLDALNWRVMLANMDKPAKENWKEIIPEKENVLLISFNATKDYFILNERSNASNRVRAIRRSDKNEFLPDFPEDIYDLSGSTGHNYLENKIRLFYSSSLSPTETYILNLENDSLSFLQKDTLLIKYNKEDYQVERIYAKASDGKLVPITLKYKKGIKRDGSNPLFLESYGSYGAPNSTGFDAGSLSYLDRGFIIATAHIRGSNDLGTQWYEDGKMLKKKNTFTDFIACAEHLIQEGYTGKEKLAINGGSAGGLLMGAVVNMRPDLFKCVVAEVPFVDVMNTMLDASLPLTTFEYEEWGNPNEKEYYDYMRSYSPYDNVEAKDYPTMLITGGYNDSQVGYWEPAKWAAKLREMKSDTNLLLLKTSMDGGHGRVSGRYNGWKEAAYKMAFVMQELGVKENYIAVTGKVEDSNGDPMPFINVYVNGTTNGTSSNFNGDFYIEIKDGQAAELVFQAIGFKKHLEKIDINTNVTGLKIKLLSENIQLRTHTVTAKSKDPAYEIIKNSIKARKGHQEAADNYTTDFYIKGVTRMTQRPEKIPKFLKAADMPDSTDNGLLYLSESVARFHRQSENYKEEMLSSKVAGSNMGFSWNRVDDVMYDFYNNSISLSYYSDKEFISPIADGAMFLYKYKYEGSFFEDGKMINKISVIPRNVASPLFHGHVYIFDNTWNFHSLELFVTKDAQLNFVDTLNISQTFAPVDENIWMPLSMKMTSKFKIFGFEVIDSYVGSLTNYQMNKSFPKKFFNNEVFKIEADANKKDTLYWVDTRPVLLTEEELKHYHKKDSISAFKNSKIYLDSLDVKRNKLTFGKVLISGYTHHSRYQKRNIGFNSLLETLNYNTVEGTVLNYSTWFYKYNDKGNFRISPTIRYGTASKQAYGKIQAFKKLHANNSIISIDGGRFVNQFNHQQPIMEEVNAIYTLAGQQNYMKIYDRTYISGSYGREIINGLYFTAGAEYNHRKPLVNNSEYAFMEWRNPITSNNPQEPFNDAPAFEPHNALILNFNFQARFKQKYETYPNYKRIIGSKYPTLHVNYRQGIKALGADVDFSFLQAGIGHSVNFGLLGSAEMDVIAGKFFYTGNMSFIDFKHFNGNQTIFLKNRSSGNTFLDQGRMQMANFNNLPYYDYSTNSNFLELHYEQRFKGFFLSKFPLLKKAKLGEVAGFNAIYTDNGRNYQEVFLGLDNIFKVMRVDFVASYVAGQRLVPQLRLGVQANF